jgi:hypothetical protein
MIHYFDPQPQELALSSFEAGLLFFQIQYPTAPATAIAVNVISVFFISSLFNKNAVQVFYDKK